MKFAVSLLALALASPVVPAGARTVGATISTFDNPFQASLRDGVRKGAEQAGVALKIEDAKGDVDRQIGQVKEFVAAKVDAIVVGSVDGDAAVTISKLAADAGIPLVYTNAEPVNVDSLPANQAFVTSDERQSSTLETREVCRRLGGKGKAVVMMGELLHSAARGRTRDIATVLSTPECSGISVVERQSANWVRGEGEELMNQWLAAGVTFDAVIANNDDMVLGAIDAMRKAGRPIDKVVFAGVDATSDALGSIALGDLDITVAQDGVAQGATALDVALKLSGGQSVPQRTILPFELVTADNLDRYAARR